MDTKYLIVGAGQAARRAAETLQQHAPSARICMVGDEPDIPYDRPLLSKDVLRSVDAEAGVFINGHGYYAENKVELRLGKRVAEIDRSRKTLHLNDGAAIAYDRLLLATGSRARPFPGPVSGQPKIYYLRTLADARRLRSALHPGKRVVVLGGGFIGLEVAASASVCGCDVAVIESAGRLLQRTMPAAVGAYMHDLHAARRVNILLDTVSHQVISHGADSAVVRTSKGDVPADIVVVGIGALPNVELAQHAQLSVNNGIVVDECCRTDDPDIFAAGDVTNHFNPLLGKHVRVESWQVAQNQPVTAALNMLGGNAIYSELPWLWSDQYDCNLQTLGFFSEQHNLIRRKGVHAGAFSVLALDADGRLQAATTVNSGRDMAVFKRLAASGQSLNADALADSSVSLRALM
ncbi:NAD(P)/FAD-dependent oxidoreductase [Undibacterium arcticum]|uniref:NAD(P)/FAD-dependent oxidoreductase n=1 Tax=Undibacterium arcticum TaxID=1762892 RepID=A0ABV7EX51_9BURK